MSIPDPRSEVLVVVEIYFKIYISAISIPVVMEKYGECVSLASEVEFVPLDMDQMVLPTHSPYFHVEIAVLEKDGCITQRRLFMIGPRQLMYLRDFT